MSDTPETLAAILAEVRASSLSTVRNWADRIEAAVQRFVADDCAKCAHYNAATISLKDALDLANTIANHGINANDLGDKASATIYALCHEVRTVRGEDSNIKQEVQKLRRELRDLRRAPGSDAALREALGKLTDAVRNYFGWDDAPAVQDRDDPTAYFCAEMSAALAALDAPPRNCDRYGDAKSALDAFIIKKRIKNEDVDVLNLRDFFDWLFEQAEGERHA